MTPAKAHTDTPDRHDGADSGHRRLRSGQLFLGAHELLIDHEGQCYRLRRTRRGKLILTK